MLEHLSASSQSKGKGKSWRPRVERRGEADADDNWRSSNQGLNLDQSTDQRDQGKAKGRTRGKGKPRSEGKISNHQESEIDLPMLGEQSADADVGTGKGSRREKRGGKGKSISKADTATGGISEGDKNAEVSSVKAKRQHQTTQTRYNDSRSFVKDAALTVAERLAEQLGRGSYDCMICLAKVGRQQSIWSCDKCWAAFHLKCIILWVKRSGDNGGTDFAFACPGCRYHRVGPMPRYTCFCTKLLEPEANPHCLAHSCGEVCEKNRGCNHPCPELCHPGPCPRCTAVGGRGNCHCGRESREATRCGDPSRWSCGDTCGKELSCGFHTCPARCHPGPCPPCSVTSTSSCFCGAKKEDRLCGNESFSCQQPCNHMFDCQEHFCERPCHPGDCGLCPREPQRWGDRCACKKTDNCSRDTTRVRLVRWVGQRTRCRDPLPLCSEPCGRIDERCGHGCRQTCHEGPCGQCGLKVQRDCRCGRTKREVRCSEGCDVLCSQVCRMKKTCGNHKCDVICCPGFSQRNHEAHLCLQVCGKALACGNHICEDFCHLGKCAPCRVVLNEPLFCACGKSSIESPVVCGSVPPPCSEPCGILMSCGHSCLARCHPGGHPLCYQLVTRQCLGGHRDMLNQRCHVGPISCGQACGRELSCGHSCIQQCHAGNCNICEQPCGARKRFCEHRCEVPCHPGHDCEDVPCKTKLKVSCPCGLRVEDRQCGAHSQLPRPQHTALRCNASCETGTSSSSTSRPPGQAKSQLQASDTKYTGDLFHLAGQHKRYVQMLEDKFLMLLSSSATAAGKTSTSQPLVLLPCDATRRLLAVEYARLHWRFKTSSKADPVEGWWSLQVALTPSSQQPRPLLSDICATSTTSCSSYLLPALGSQACIRVMGLKGAGDEVYDLLGLDGLLGIRPAQRRGEVLAFFDRGATAEATFKRLTGQAPSSEATAIKTSGGWNSNAPVTGGLRLLLEQTLSGGHAKRQPAKPDAQEKPQQAEKTEDVPDDWEDSFD